MFIEYDITLKEMKGINPVAVSDVHPAKLCAPKPMACRVAKGKDK